MSIIQKTVLCRRGMLEFESIKPAIFEIPLQAIWLLFALFGSWAYPMLVANNAGL